MFIIRVFEIFAVIVLGVTSFGSAIGAFIAVAAPFFNFSAEFDSWSKPRGLFTWIFLALICWFIAAFLFVLGFYCGSGISYIITGQCLDWNK